MSFYSYKNCNAEGCPGKLAGDVCNGLNQKICIQVKNVFDACMQQEQLDDVCVTVTDIVPVLPDPCNCNCNCNNNCNPITHAEAVENAANTPCPPTQPVGNWTFESCRSSTTAGTIRNLSIDRMCDRPQFARIRGIVDIPIDILFLDARCQEWMGRAVVSVTKDVLLCIPDESIVPFTLETLVSAICVTGTYMGNNRFEITICVTVVLKILAEVELMVPSYGYCPIPPCEEFAENVCDEFFSLPLFPQQSCCNSCNTNNCNTCNTSNNCNHCNNGCNCNNSCRTCSTCSNCGTTCGTNCSQCPRCGCTMTCN